MRVADQHKQEPSWEYSLAFPVDLSHIIRRDYARFHTTQRQVSAPSGMSLSSR